MERGDIYLVCPDPTSGHEQQGTRPVLVISPSAFNHRTRTPIVLPITTGGNFACTAGFAVSLPALEQRRQALCVATSLVPLTWPRATDASWSVYLQRSSMPFWPGSQFCSSKWTRLLPIYVYYDCFDCCPSERERMLRPMRPRCKSTSTMRTSTSCPTVTISAGSDTKRSAN